MIDTYWYKRPKFLYLTSSVNPCVVNRDPAGALTIFTGTGSEVRIGVNLGAELGRDGTHSLMEATIML